jgi:chaperonin GroEL (HSP60 family)
VDCGFTFQINEDARETLLAKSTTTMISSKLIGGEKEFFASMVVDVVLAIGNDDKLNTIGIKKGNFLISLYQNLHVNP